MKKGDTLELDIERYAYEGKGVAKIDKSVIKPDEPVVDDYHKSKYVVFVHGSYPGDRVIAKLRKIKKSYAEAKSITVISPSEFRVTPRCKYFGTCGGCKQQDLDYSIQSKYKAEQVEEIFKIMGGFGDYDKEEIIGSDRNFFYRNKMEFSFAEKRWLTEEEISTNEKIERDFALGLHIPGMFDKVLDIDECFLQSELSNKILEYNQAIF